MDTAVTGHLWGLVEARPAESVTDADADGNTFVATLLTETDLIALRAQAAQAIRYIDEAQLRRVRTFTAGRTEWAAAILGRPFTLRGLRNNAEIVLLDLAAEREPHPPTRPRPKPAPVPIPPDPRDPGWQQLRAALPVPLWVAYNYSGPRHFELYHSGADHIVLDEPLIHRTLRRSAGDALCESPSRAAHLQFEPSARNLDVDRIPTCKRCLRTAYWITGLTHDSSLFSHPRRDRKMPRTDPRNPA